jgi:4a-hydroxytetrahydrobiopterin dehydratase
MALLSQDKIEIYLRELDSWELDDNAIKREWVFQDFSEALDFINMVAVICESHNHHPEIRNVYNRVSLRFFTHDVGGLSEKDFDIAKEINKI